MSENYEGHNWERVHSGTCQIVNSPSSASSNPISHIQKRAAHLLSQIPATSICGNDLTSSCLYVAGLCGYAAGKYAWISLLIVALTLSFFRAVYAEVGTALPLNGGVYNCLLNCTSKKFASVGATLTIISYIATAVVSGSDAIAYLKRLVPNVDMFLGTIGVLLVFCLLNLIGISESSVAATIIFIFHLSTLACLMVVSIIKFDSKLFGKNWDMPPPDGNSAIGAIYFGFASAMLGISGFETSANFIEEQAEDVYPKTLRNMLFFAVILNPTLSFLGLGIVDMGDIVNFKATFLAQMGKDAGGHWLSTLVEVDAFIVLSGAVLTAYVGVTGLARRMALDRLFPQFFLAQNKLRKTNHVIIIGFFLTCSLMYILVNGQIEALAAVYTFAFLCVMALWAIGGQILKYKRGRLLERNKYKSSWTTTILALIFVTIGLVGNVQAKPQDLGVFFLYFAVAMFLVYGMFIRVRVVKFLYFVVHKVFSRFEWGQKLEVTLKHKYQSMMNNKIIFFASRADLVSLNKAALYVRENELCAWLKIVHFYQEEDSPISQSTDLDPTAKIAMQKIVSGLESSNNVSQPHSRTVSFIDGAESGSSVETRRPSDANKPHVSLNSLGSENLYQSSVIPSYLDPNTLSHNADSGDLYMEAPLLNSSSKSNQIEQFAPAFSQVNLLSLPRPKNAPDIATNVAILDSMYPKLRIDYVGIKGQFNPEAIDWVSEQFGVEKNFMFIACLSDKFQHDLSSLGGVRTITSYKYRSKYIPPLEDSQLTTTTTTTTDEIKTTSTPTNQVPDPNFVI